MKTSKEKSEKKEEVSLNFSLLSLLLFNKTIT